jgi:membrane-associated phospholipid phosphatase
MNLEIEILKWFQHISTSFLDIVAELITMLGEQYLLIIIVVFVYFVYNKKLGEIFAYSVIVSATLNNTIKGIFQAKRPFEVNPDIINKRPETSTGFSFPSGHSQNAATFYTSLGFILRKKWTWIVFGIIISLVGLSRMYLGVHFFRDVILGIILGIGMAFLGQYLFNKFGDNPRSKIILLGITALVFLPFLIIFYKSDYEALGKFKDFYTTYALYIGFAIAIIIENKYVNFTCDTALSKRIYRFVIALFLFIAIQFGLKSVFPAENIFFDMLRYFLNGFVTLGLFPLTFKSLKLL